MTDAQVGDSAHVGDLVMRCATPSATQSLGAVIADIVQPGDVVVLTGDLGAGKTTFVKGVIAALGGTTTVTSPTFVLCHLYDTDPVVAHVDCWRFENPEEVIDLALTEVLDDGGVAFVEWGDIATQYIGGDFLRMSFAIDAPTDEALSDDEAFFDESLTVARTVAVAASGKSWAMRLDQLRATLRHEPLIMFVEKMSR